MLVVDSSNMGKSIRLNESGNMRWLPHGGVHGPLTNTRQDGGCVQIQRRGMTMVDGGGGGGGRGEGHKRRGFAQKFGRLVVVRFRLTFLFGAGCGDLPSPA